MFPATGWERELITGGERCCWLNRLLIRKPKVDFVPGALYSTPRFVLNWAFERPAPALGPRAPPRTAAMFGCSTDPGFCGSTYSCAAVEPPGDVTLVLGMLTAWLLT